MSRPLCIVSVLIGTFWSQVLLVAGLALLLTPVVSDGRRIAGLALFGAGCFVAMGLVIDRLVPEAGPVVVVPLKLAAVLAFWVCGGVTVYRIATGQGIDLTAVL